MNPWFVIATCFVSQGKMSHASLGQPVELNLSNIKLTLTGILPVGEFFG
jgi:hypothetical protein